MGRRGGGSDLIFSHFERSVVCVLCVWNWMASPFGERPRGKDLYSPAVCEWHRGGAQGESRAADIELPLCANGLL